MKTSKDIFKCSCGYEIEVTDVNLLNISKRHFDMCMGKDYQSHIDNIYKIKGCFPDLSELKIAHDLFWGN